MWTVLKFDNKKINTLQKELHNKLGSDYKIYMPKILIKRYIKKKYKESEICLLGNYMFCYHKNFQNSSTINQLRFMKGLKYFVNGFYSSQNEIEKFIEKCKKLENKKGYITQNIFDIIETKKYKFISGPFSNQIFEIMKFQKNKIEALIGNFRTKIDKEKFLSFPI